MDLHKTQYRIWKKHRKFVRWKLMFLSSQISDRYFHEWFSQSNDSNPEISSSSVTNFEDVSEHLFECEICSIRNGVTIVLEILSDECCWFHCYSHILQILECSSPFPGTLEILFCLFRTWSFTRFTNDLDPTDNSNSVPPFPMTKFWGLANSWELMSSGRPDLSRNASSFLTDWTRRISPNLSNVVQAKHGRHPTLNHLLKRNFP